MSKQIYPFPYGTISLLVTKKYLGLEDGPPIFKQDTTCPVLLILITIIFAYRTFTQFRKTLQFIYRKNKILINGLIRVLSPILTESLLISFSLATKMFQFAKFYNKKIRFPLGRFIDYKYRYLPITFRLLSRPFFQCLGIHKVSFFILKLYNNLRISFLRAATIPYYQY